MFIHFSLPPTQIPSPTLYEKNINTSNTLQTSALDTHTEQALLSHINSILKEKKRTSVFVAHRLRTIYDSDLIIVLRAGSVAESGTHEELINRAGLYTELWSAQETLFSGEEKGKVVEEGEELEVEKK